VTWTQRVWLGLGLLSCACQASEAEGPVLRTLGDDLFAMGATVRVTQSTAGDALVAGGSVSVAAEVRGDGVVAGGELELIGPFRDDLYAAGGQLRVVGPTAGNARLAGGRVLLTSTARVDGNLSVAAGAVNIDGVVGKYLQVAAGETRLDGHVAGPVEIAGGKLEVGPRAVIEGDLTFRGPEIRVDSQAQIRGRLRHLPPQDDGLEGAGAAVLIVLAGVAACLGATLVAALFQALLPQFVASVGRSSREHPWQALLVGLAVAGGTPVAIVCGLLSVVGIPLALLALFVYVLLYPLGYLALGVMVAERLSTWLQRDRERTLLLRLVALAIAFFALTLVGLVPFIGQAAVVLGTLLGMGALLLAVRDAYRSGKARDGSRPAAPLE
jgi:hypothetical protein